MEVVFLRRHLPPHLTGVDGIDGAVQVVVSLGIQSDLSCRNIFTVLL